MQVQPLTSDGKIPDLVRQITNALGGVISITYSTLSNPAVYRPGAPAAYPNASARRYVAHLSPAQFPTQEVIGRAICVVSGYTLSSDARMNRYAYERRFAMQYEDARIGLTGRGWQGFAKVTTTDLDTGLLRVQRYLQDFPYQGRLAGESAEVDTTGSDGKVTVRRLGRTVHVYQAVQPTATAKVQEVRKMGPWPGTTKGRAGLRGGHQPSLRRLWQSDWQRLAWLRERDRSGCRQPGRRVSRRGAAGHG